MSQDPQKKLHRIIFFKIVNNMKSFLCWFDAYSNDF